MREIAKGDLALEVAELYKEHADRIGEQVYGVPDLVVEIISPATRKTDRLEKFSEYARAGVQELEKSQRLQAYEAYYASRIPEDRAEELELLADFAFADAEGREVCE